MRKNVFGRRLKRDKNERKGLFKSLMSSLVLYEKIKTTEEKAKAIKGQIEKLVTIAKKDEKLAMKSMSGYFSAEALKKLVSNVASRFKKRNGGYIRIIKLGNRVSDNANMVLVEWTEQGIQKPELRIKNENEEKNKLTGLNRKNISTRTQKKKETQKRKENK